MESLCGGAEGGEELSSKQIERRLSPKPNGLSRLHFLLDQSLYG